MLVLHSDGICVVTQPASLTLFPSSLQSFLHPGRYFSLTNPFLLQAGKNNSALHLHALAPIRQSRQDFHFCTVLSPRQRNIRHAAQTTSFHSRHSRTLVHCNSYQPRHTSLAHNKHETHDLKYEHSVTKPGQSLQRILSLHFILFVVILNIKPPDFVFQNGFFNINQHLNK